MADNRASIRPRRDQTGGAHEWCFESPGRMELSDHERRLAINIKTAIAADPELDPVSDFMCAQLALVDGDNIEGSLARVQQLQWFREEYGVRDTVEDASKQIADYIKLFPRLQLCFTFYNDGGNYVMVADNAEFDSSQVRSEENLRSWLCGSYYLCAAFSPDFESIRKGLVVIVECEGYSWKKGFDFKSLKRLWSEIAAVYPFSIDKVKYFNAGTTMTLVTSMLKPFLPAEFRRRLEFGYQSDQRLDSLYLVPSLEVATLRLQGRLEETLRKRYDNERLFRLEPLINTLGASTVQAEVR